MDKDNVLSEGLIDKLIKSLIPTSIQKKITQNSIQNLKKQNIKIEKELEVLNKKQSDAAEKMRKALEKQYGVKIKRQSAEKAIEDFYGR
tara:strand:- start:288 stop:554 length:267 start_codon:yes stop_codon:yes gene_type:complete